MSDIAGEKYRNKQELIPTRHMGSSCQSGVCGSKKETGRTPHCCVTDASPVRGQWERTIQDVHVLTSTVSATLFVASVPHPGRLLLPKMYMVEEQAFGCSGSHRRRHRSSVHIYVKSLQSTGLIGPRQRRCRYLGNTCVTVTECKPGGGRAGSRSSWKNLYEK